jgi:hypothetical protein
MNQDCQSHHRYACCPNMPWTCMMLHRHFCWKSHYFFTFLTNMAVTASSIISQKNLTSALIFVGRSTKHFTLILHNLQQGQRSGQYIFNSSGQFSAYRATTSVATSTAALSTATLLTDPQIDSHVCFNLVTSSTTSASATWTWIHS